MYFSLDDHVISSSYHVRLYSSYEFTAHQLFPYLESNQAYMASIRKANVDMHTLHPGMLIFHAESRHNIFDDMSDEVVTDIDSNHEDSALSKGEHDDDDKWSIDSLDGGCELIVSPLPIPTIPTIPTVMPYRKTSAADHGALAPPNAHPVTLTVTYQLDEEDELHTPLSSSP